MKIDAIDFQLIDALSKNGKLNTKELSSIVGLTVTPTFERVKRLERLGVISGYKAIVNEGLLGKKIEVICEVVLKEHSDEFISNFEESIRKLDEISSCKHTAGEYDYMLVVRTQDMEEYYTFLRSKLSTIPHIANVKSAFVLNEVK